MCFNGMPLEISSRISVDLNEISIWHVLAGYRFIQIVILLTSTLLYFLVMQWDVIIKLQIFPAIKLQGRLYDTFGLLLETT